MTEWMIRPSETGVTTADVVTTLIMRNSGEYDGNH